MKFNEKSFPLSRRVSAVNFKKICLSSGIYESNFTILICWLWLINKDDGIKTRLVAIPKAPWRLCLTVNDENSAVRLPETLATQRF